MNSPSSPEPHERALVTPRVGLTLREGIAGMPDVVSVDTECSGLFPDDGARIASIAVAWEGASVAIPVGQGPLKESVIEGDWHDLLGALEVRELVFHNGLYDLAMLMAGTVSGFPGVDLTSNLYWDTMLAQRQLRPTRSAGLDQAAREWGLGGKQGLDTLKGWLKQNKLPVRRYDLAPWHIVEPYVTTDAEETFDLFGLQVEELESGIEGDAVADWLERELALCKVLVKLERRGVGYDVKQSREIAAELQQAVDETEAKMPFECSINKAKHFFFDVQGLEPDRRTEKGAKSLDDEQVRDWATAGVPWAKEYHQVKWAKRAISMWYAGYPEKIGSDGRLRGRYRQGSVSSGRLSIERVQLQAMPKADRIRAEVPGVRDLLRPREGHQLWSLDMQQAELRVAAKYSHCKRMLAMLEEGIDLHGKTCEDVMGVRPSAKDWKLRRDIAKRLTFGSIFMIGGKTFQRTLAKLADIHWPLSDCERVVRVWRATYPEFGVAYRKSDRLFAERGWMKILPGTPYETRSYMQERDWAHTGWNRCVQGSLAAFLRMWLVQVERTLPGAAILTVHDSIVLELKPEDAGLAKDMADLGAEMAEELFDFPMPCEIEQLAKEA